MSLLSDGIELELVLSLLKTLDGDSIITLSFNSLDLLSSEVSLLPSLVPSKKRNYYKLQQILLTIVYLLYHLVLQTHRLPFLQ